MPSALPPSASFSFMAGPSRPFHFTPSLPLSLLRPIWPNTAAATTPVEFFLHGLLLAPRIKCRGWVFSFRFVFFYAMTIVHSKAVCLPVFAHTILPKKKQNHKTPHTCRSEARKATNLPPWYGNPLIVPTNETKTYTYTHKKSCFA